MMASKFCLASEERTQAARSMGREYRSGEQRTGELRVSLRTLYIVYSQLAFDRRFLLAKVVLGIPRSMTDVRHRSSSMQLEKCRPLTWSSWPPAELPLPPPGPSCRCTSGSPGPTVCQSTALFIAMSGGPYFEPHEDVVFLGGESAKSFVMRES